MIINHLFPRVVAEFNIGRNFTEKERKFIKDLEYISNQTNYVSKRTDILKSQELYHLYSFFQNSLDQYVNEILKPKNKSLMMKITESWVNKTYENEFHPTHAHPNSFLSGVFYFNSIDSDAITRLILFLSNNYQLKISL